MVNSVDSESKRGQVGRPVGNYVGEVVRCTGRHWVNERLARCICPQQVGGGCQDSSDEIKAMGTDRLTPHIQQVLEFSIEGEIGHIEEPLGYYSPHPAVLSVLQTLSAPMVDSYDITICNWKHLENVWNGRITRNFRPKMTPFYCQKAAGTSSLISFSSQICQDEGSPKLPIWQLRSGTSQLQSSDHRLKNLVQCLTEG